VPAVVTTSRRQGKLDLAKPGFAIALSKGNGLMTTPQAKKVKR
jgi:hypothetical protein